MGTSKLYYWDTPWPGHVGLGIDLDALRTGPQVQAYAARELGLADNDARFRVPMGLQGLSNYVSWTAGGVINAKALGSGLKAYARTFEEDQVACGGAAPKSVELPNLDIERMRLEWAAIRTKEGAHWKMLAKNCSVVVLRVLKAGGADQHVHNYLKRNPAVITPAAVYLYAKAAARHI